MRALVVAFTLMAAAQPVLAAPSTIRVAIVESTRTAEVRGAEIDVSPLDGRGGECERCGRGWRADTVRAVMTGRGIAIEGRRSEAFRLRAATPLRVNGRDYPATVELVKNGDGMAVVNELPLEDYLAGVLQAEIGDRWPIEALRAQAIAARTYAAYQRLLNDGKPYHIVSSTSHQLYSGRVLASSPAWAAVQDTSAQVLRWEGELFPAFYHAESGGYTEDPRSVFASPNLPALKPVVCQFSGGSPHFYWNLDLKLSDLSEILRRNAAGVGAVRSIDVTERTPALRAVSLVVRGSRGSVRLRGNEFRRMVGYDTLKSTLFAVAIDHGVAHFAGRGYGHGVGMCQWGAKGMAEQGYKAAQILAFYYPGAVLGPLDRP